MLSRQAVSFFSYGVRGWFAPGCRVLYRISGHVTGRISTSAHNEFGSPYTASLEKTENLNEWRETYVYCRFENTDVQKYLPSMRLTQCWRKMKSRASRNWKGHKNLKSEVANKLATRETPGLETQGNEKGKTSYMQIQTRCHIGDQAAKHLSWEAGMQSIRSMDICKWIEILHHMCNKESKWTISNPTRKTINLQFSGHVEETKHTATEKDRYLRCLVNTKDVPKVYLNRHTKVLPSRGDSTETCLYDNHWEQDSRESNRALIHEMVILIERVISRQRCYKKMQYGIGRCQQNSQVKQADRSHDSLQLRSHRNQSHHVEHNMKHRSME